MNSNTVDHNLVVSEGKLGFAALDGDAYLVKIFTKKSTLPFRREISPPSVFIGIN